MYSCFGVLDDVVWKVWIYLKIESGVFCSASEAAVYPARNLLSRPRPLTRCIRSLDIWFRLRILLRYQMAELIICVILAFGLPVQLLRKVIFSVKVETEYRVQCCECGRTCVNSHVVHIINIGYIHVS